MKHNKVVRALNTVSYQVAIGNFLEGCPDNSEELFKPAWLDNLGSGHDLFYCRGLGFCARCGGVGSSLRASDLLQAECRRVLPLGSRSRLKRALQGRHPHFAADSWPDGSAATEVGPVRRVGSQSLLDVEVHVEEVLRAACSGHGPVDTGTLGADPAQVEAGHGGGTEALPQTTEPAEPNTVGVDALQQASKPKVPRIDRARFKF